jgi:hypothetical protein
MQASARSSLPRRREIGFIYPVVHTVGVDLGQSHDPTAICVVETEVKTRCFYDGWSAEPRQVPEGVQHRVRHLERLALGTPYPAQVEVVLGLHRSALLKDPEVVIDETGVGRAVGDMFEAGGLKPTRASITAGSEESRSGAASWRVAKIVLVSRLQASLHSGELKFAAALGEARTLRQELSEFRMRHTASGAATFGAREGRHDDLVLATAIALWRAQARSRGSGFAQVPLLICPG